MIKWVYFDINYAVHVHDWIIEKSGGLHGAKDTGSLTSVLTHIQNDMYYPNFEDKLCHLVFSIVKLHAFNDGNKRSSIVLGAYLLEINGFDFCIKPFMRQMENIVVWVAEGKIDKPLLLKIIQSILYESDYSEALKLELVYALTKDDI